MTDTKILRRLVPLAVYPMSEMIFFVLACRALSHHSAWFLLFFGLAAVFLSYSIHITFHECVHSGMSFEGPSAVLSGWISVLAGIPLHGYRAHHFNHHRYENSTEDYSSTWVKRAGTVRPRQFVIYGLGWPASFLRTRNGLKREISSGRLPASMQRKIRLEGGVLLVFLTVLAVCAWKFALLYLGLVYCGWVVTSWHNYIQHPPLLNSKIVTTSFPGRFYNRFFANNGLHWEHHDSPGTPWSELVSAMNVRFVWQGAAAAFEGRQLLGIAASEFLKGEMEAFGPAASPARWRVDLKETLLFDRSGLRLIQKALFEYRGPASRISFALKPDFQAFRDYYSLQNLSAGSEVTALPVTATRAEGDPEKSEQLILELPASRTSIPFPKSLTDPILASTPMALLLPYESDFDILFANQILVVSDLAKRIGKSPWTWLKSVLPVGRLPWKRRLAMNYKSIHPSAQIHPTAVIEGSVIGAGASIGAHCVVRFSSIGENVRLHDGAKVELSVVGKGSWLMHDLVLYRSHTEDAVFLIHGPYQFSSFQSGSAAFATIMMDYRPDGKPIRVKTPGGVRNYLGPFLGSVLKPGAKTFGGSLIAPGRIIPGDTWLACEAKSVHTVDTDTSLPTRKTISPSHFQ